MPVCRLLGSPRRSIRRDFGLKFTLWSIGTTMRDTWQFQRRATSKHSWDIDWRPERLSVSFHGRDLFAPVAAMLARGEPPPGRPRKDGTHRRTDWPDDLREIIYIDHYGNAMSGLRALTLPRSARLIVAGRVLERAGTFSDRPPGTARTLTDLPKSPSIKDALTASSILRSAVPSKSLNKPCSATTCSMTTHACNRVTRPKLGHEAGH